MKERVLITISLLFALTGHTQQERNWLLDMSKNYRDAKSCSMSIKVGYYSSFNDSAPLLMRNGVVCFGGKYYRSNLMGKTVISNENCSLLIDENQKVIVRGAPINYTKKDTSIQAPTVEALLDSGLFKNSDVKLTAQQGNTRSIKIIPKGGLYNYIVMDVDIADHTLTRMVYVYKPAEGETQSAKVIITFSDVRINVDLNENDFSEKNFITKSKGSYAGTGKYAAYEFIDQTTGHE